MKNLFFFLFLLYSFVSVNAQKDSIILNLKVNDDDRTIFVEQTLIYHNPHKKPIQEIKFLNWIASYQRRKTPLLKRKIENRKNDLYFAKANEMGLLENLKYSQNNVFYEISDSSKENIYIPLSESLQPEKSITIHLKYQIKLPNSRFTGYGVNESKILLKYFFLVPETYEDESQSESFYKDLEETANLGSHWRVNFQSSEKWNIYSNLKKIETYKFEGNSINDAEFLLTSEILPQFNLITENENTEIQLGYQTSFYQKQILESLLKNHLKYIKNKTGIVPEKLFITEKFFNSEKFIGIDDIQFGKFKYQILMEYEKTDLEYFSTIAKKIMDEFFITNKIKDHWLKNGLKTYIEAQYIKDTYPDQKLIGNLAENVDFYGIKPLKMFHASKLKLSDRYGLPYHYIYTKNLDQNIMTPYDELSNFNTKAISQFEMGSLLNYISEYQGSNSFDSFLKQFFLDHYKKKIDGHFFINSLEKYSKGKTLFLGKMMSEKHRINFKLKGYKNLDSNYYLNICKKSTKGIPLKIETENQSKVNKIFWKQGNDTKIDSITIPSDNTRKIILNNDYIFPETNFRDNYISTKGLFSNMKKIKFKLIKDIQNPEYNEIFISPKLIFNAYDKFLLGINFKNQGLLDQKFQYSITPFYSTGTSKITGSAGFVYSILPPNSFFRRLDFGVSGSYFHYDKNLSYKRLGASTSLNFNKPLRSAINRSLYFSYNHYERELSPLRILNNESSKYNLWNFGYAFSDNQMIHEKYFGTNIQWMEDFQKISAEAFYRWEFVKNKKMSFRWFAGYFIKNNTHNNLFNYGLSRVSNYTFSYGLLGQSATTGILSQQFILAEGGFKSMFNNSVNHFITSMNVDAHVWKCFNLYADAGIYKNKNKPTQFIWDSGIKIKVIPDFLEIYFPVASSLGFEPGLNNYAQRIRYTLVLNLGALVNNLRRGIF